MMLELRDVRTQVGWKLAGIARICFAPFWHHIGELFIFGIVVRLVIMVVKLVVVCRHCLGRGGVRNPNEENDQNPTGGTGNVISTPRRREAADPRRLTNE